MQFFPQFLSSPTAGQQEDILLEAKNAHVNGRHNEIIMDPFETSLPMICIAELDYITDNFNMNPLTQGGRKLGAGAFGTVFLGKLTKPSVDDTIGVSIYQKLRLPIDAQVAVKRLNSQKVCCYAQLKKSGIKKEFLIYKSIPFVGS